MLTELALMIPFPPPGGSSGTALWNGMPAALCLVIGLKASADFSEGFTDLRGPGPDGVSGEVSLISTNKSAMMVSRATPAMLSACRRETSEEVE